MYKVKRTLKKNILKKRKILLILVKHLVNCLHTTVKAFFFFNK